MLSEVVDTASLKSYPGQAMSTVHYNAQQKSQHQ